MSKYVKEIKIKNYNHFIKIIQGKTCFCEDLREKFIFRGMEDDTYEFKPSALRTNSKLNDFVDEDFKLTLSIPHEKAVKYGFAKEEDYYDDVKSFTVNKYGELIDEKVNDYAWSWEEFQCVKELNTLMKFLSYADKVGLKVPVKQNIREQLEQNFQNIFDHENTYWPCDDLYELMALAQHYGIPTRALDWSYDYRTALYFAVKNILNEDYLTNKKPENGILWAFNYKFFNRHQIQLNKLHYIKHYRPEYNTNPNLNAQKGLFTFVIKRVWETADKTFEEDVEEFLENYNPHGRIISNDEQVFYKFIIPEDKKPDILKELYFEGYSEENLFPGYEGVSKHVINEVKLKKLSKDLKTSKKNILLSVKWNLDKVKNKEKLYEFIQHNFEFKIDKIFIYQNQEVIGYFKGNEIIKDTHENLWDKFGNQSGISKRKFNETFKDCDCFAIRINDLNLFKYPVKLCEFKLNDDFCYIKENDENLNFLLNFT